MGAGSSCSETSARVVLAAARRLAARPSKASGASTFGTVGAYGASGADRPRRVAPDENSRLLRRVPSAMPGWCRYAAWRRRVAERFAVNPLAVAVGDQLTPAKTATPQMVQIHSGQSASCPSLQGACSNDCTSRHAGQSMSLNTCAPPCATQSPISDKDDGRTGLRQSGGLRRRVGYPQRCSPRRPCLVNMAASARGCRSEPVAVPARLSEAAAVADAGVVHEASGPGAAGVPQAP